MANNPVALIIPCHRVLTAGGKVGGFSAPGGSATKIRMLAREGVHVGQSQFSAPLAAQIAERSAIRDVQNWVLENLAQPLSVDQLADRAGMSVRNFARNFKRETQSTPAEFVERARLDTARRMLEETKQPMKRIADVAGFGDSNTLRRAFLRQLGVTPADYRRRF